MIRTFGFALFALSACTSQPASDTKPDSERAAHVVEKDPTAEIHSGSPCLGTWISQIDTGPELVIGVWDDIYDGGQLALHSDGDKLFTVGFKAEGNSVSFASPEGDRRWRMTCEPSETRAQLEDDETGESRSLYLMPEGKVG
ncbi:hypothetical protein [Qipengyuania sp. RANM35]|uniref:hypothetical protein n=1 Tax=Qipengyuania sp. RANM35 TaxID=3068635 RepID=UPI0034DB5E21